MQSTFTSPPEIAIVGAGPSGFYAAEALLKLGINVALIERLPAPFGLVRYGVAPDHQKLKTTIAAYDRIAQSSHLHFFGNVEVGRDVSVASLRKMFHAVIFAQGAHGDRTLGISGEDLRGCHGASAFVGWYNGHPDCRDHAFDLSQEAAVILGNGNVALDIARILAKPVEALGASDIADHALQALAASNIRDIHIVGRRGPSQAKFSANELRELAQIENCSIHFDARDLADANPPNSTVAWLSSLAHSAVNSHRRRIHFHFFKRPVCVEGTQRMSSMLLEKTQVCEADPSRVTGTGEEFQIPAGLLFKAVGYRGQAIRDLPFDHERGVVPTLQDRVLGDEGQAIPRLYATGWVKRGPSGVIGTNRADSVAVTRRVVEDLAAEHLGDVGGVQALQDHLCGRTIIAFKDWLRIDQAEIAAGLVASKPREKFTRVQELLAAAQ